MEMHVTYNAEGRIAGVEYTGTGLVEKYYRCECRKCTLERNECHASIGDFERVADPLPLPTTVRDLFAASGNRAIGG